MRKIFATVKFITFWLWVATQFPLVLVLLPFGKRAGLWQFRFFTNGVLKIAGICVKTFGEISKKRPLLLVGNHISVFEFMTFPAVFGGSFFGKKEIEKYPVVGWFGKRFGVVYIDRRPSQAVRMVKKIEDELSKTTWPMVIYPEGTTSNGSVVLPFKSSMFSFIEDGAKVTIQPMVMLYRDKCGNKIPDQIMADDYAYFDNKKMPESACVCRKERSAFGQVFHVFELGGFTVEFHLLAPPKLAGKDRKEIAETLYKTVNKKFIELK